jgi:hypothetical protein
MHDVYLRSIVPLIAIILDRVYGSDPQLPPRPAIAALLGRFLPGLGPLVATQAAFLFCVCRHVLAESMRPSVLVPAHGHRAHIAHQPLCTTWYIIYRDMRNCKYLHTPASRGPRATPYAPEDPEPALATRPCDLKGFLHLDQGNTRTGYSRGSPCVEKNRPPLLGAKRRCPMGVAGWRFAHCEENCPRPGGRCRPAGRLAVYLPGGGRNRLADHDHNQALQGLAAVRGPDHQGAQTKFFWPLLKPKTALLIFLSPPEVAFGCLMGPDQETGTGRVRCRS